MTEGHPPELPPWLAVTATERTPGPGARDAVLPAATARTRADLFAALVDVLDLPGYVGRNWDALADSLRDLLDAGPLTLLVDDATQLLADEPPGHLGLLLTLLGDAAADALHPLRVVLRDAPDRIPVLRRRAVAALPRR
ncbi:Barstar (barnase inhibitor) [Micromonospora sp. MW-13]|uniref:barstar family protein n=1 Tax=Micromonospora sp. MW-13 TaxID=2094022 RepID=UPI000E43F79B|nr:barstar family protein [Micromonospora sp. MW-13]RGC67637.1 Barstar (barnase inhibitor) [Micromonospora sp. MW-13]